jgi:hypothetical protein
MLGVGGERLGTTTRTELQKVWRWSWKCGGLQRRVGGLHLLVKSLRGEWMGRSVIVSARGIGLLSDKLVW